MSCSYTVVAWNPWIRAVVKNVLVHPVSALHHINGFVLTAPTVEPAFVPSSTERYRCHPSTA